MHIRPLAVAVLAISAFMPALPAKANETVEQAVWLIERATLVHRDGFHNVLLRSLRQMADPRLEPLFSELTQRRHPGLKIHGILGLAELKSPPKLDLALVADIKETAVQAQLLSAAIDSDLLTTEDANQLTQWPGLDASIRVLVAGKLIADGNTVDPAVLNDALVSENQALKAMATLLKLHIEQGDPLAMLKEFDASTSPNRDQIRALLLQTAMKYEFKIIAPWASQMLNEPDIDRTLMYQALRASLMFGVIDTVNFWSLKFDTAESVAERLRLAMLVLDIAKDVHPRIFEKLIDEDLPDVQQIGKVGLAIRNAQPVDQAIDDLVRMNNLVASRWALQYAVLLSDTDPAKARPILITMVRAAGDETPRFRAQRLEHAVLATQKLFENDPQAVEPLRQLLNDSPVVVQEAMLMGLIRVGKGGNPTTLTAPISEWKSRMAQAMALVIQAKHTNQLTADQLEELSLIVRGGAGLQDPLRIQAAWAYLKHTHQDRIALATVLGGNGN